MIIIPHQDDEIFCYAYLKYEHELVVVFKGGGEPKGYILDPEELYKRRCEETVTTCKGMNVSKVHFLGVQRPYTTADLDKALINFLADRNPDYIITTMTADAHPDHVALGKSMLRCCKVSPLYGFIVGTDALVGYSKKNKSLFEYELSEKEHKHKVKLVDNYITQKHFLPIVLKRPQYKIEKYWRLK